MELKTSLKSFNNIKNIKTLYSIEMQRDKKISVAKHL